jgi:hypothetical protein
MKRRETNIHRATQAGKTLFISLEELSPADFEEYDGRDPSSPLEITTETLEIPLFRPRSTCGMVAIAFIRTSISPVRGVF